MRPRRVGEEGGPRGPAYEYRRAAFSLPGPVRRVAWAAARTVLVLASAAGLAACGAERSEPESDPEPPVVRIATFNVEELSASKVDSVDAAGRGIHPQLQAAAGVVRTVRPDVLVLNEVDLVYGPDARLGDVVRAFQERYLEVEHEEIVGEPVTYPHLFVAPSNTGILSGVDLNRDGVVAGRADRGERIHGDDAFGFGVYPGQYSMAVLSRVPVAAGDGRTFRTFLWKDLPGNHLPGDFYSDTARAVLRLSSKSHWDVPLVLGGDTLRLWVSHPTPPVFDGPENRNGRRNYDEIGFWVRYLEGSEALYDDRGRRGGYAEDDPFVVAGDLNADPSGGEAVLDGRPAIDQLLGHPDIQDPQPLRGVPTASFGGGMRVDYLLPSAGLEVVGGGVFGESPAGEAGDPDPAAASDHRLVWLDLRLPGG